MWILCQNSKNIKNIFFFYSTPLLSLLLLLYLADHRAGGSLHISQVLHKLPLFASQALGFCKAPRVTLILKKVELNGTE